MFDEITDELIASIPDVHVSGNENMPVSDSETILADVPLSGTTTATTDVPAVAAATDVSVSGTAAQNGPRMLNGPRMFNGPRMLIGPRMLNCPRMFNGPRMLNGPTVTNAAKLKNTSQQIRRRTSNRLRKLKSKNITGPGATAAAPMVLDESEEGVLTQEETTQGTKE